MKKFAGDIMILQMCTKNHNHMLFLRHGVWQTGFFVIMDHFSPLYWGGGGGGGWGGSGFPTMNVTIIRWNRNPNIDYSLYGLIILIIPLLISCLFQIFDYEIYFKTMRVFWKQDISLELFSILHDFFSLLSSAFVKFLVNLEKRA